MAVYKVPQNVEADDKLLGPFSFRQVIYLFVVAGGVALGWVLFQLFPPLVIIPLPIIVFFGALALPLRKDQPMETYLRALVSYFLKPRKRLWDPDGQQLLVEITAPKVSDRPYIRDISGNEAERRLSYLSNVVDTRGWAVRGVNSDPSQNTSMNSDVFYEAQQTQDVMDTTNRTASLINSQLDQADARHRQELMARMHQAPSQPAQPATIPQTIPELSPQPTSDDSLPELPKFNPYPNNIHQSVIQPLSSISQPSSSQAPVRPEVTSETTMEPPSKKVVSPDIINLANNPDLSIETIAHEAYRIKERQQDLPDDEVVVSLR